MDCVLIQDVQKMSTMKIGFPIRGPAVINDWAQAVMFQPLFIYKFLTIFVLNFDPHFQVKSADGKVKKEKENGFSR